MLYRVQKGKGNESISFSLLNETIAAHFFDYIVSGIQTVLSSPIMMRCCTGYRKGKVTWEYIILSPQCDHCYSLVDYIVSGIQTVLSSLIMMKCCTGYRKGKVMRVYHSPYSMRPSLLTCVECLCQQIL